MKFLTMEKKMVKNNRSASCVKVHIDSMIYMNLDFFFISIELHLVNSFL